MIISLSIPFLLKVYSPHKREVWMVQPNTVDRLSCHTEVNDVHANISNLIEFKLIISYFTFLRGAHTYVSSVFFQQDFSRFSETKAKPIMDTWPHFKFY